MDSDFVIVYYTACGDDVVCVSKMSQKCQDKIKSAYSYLYRREHLYCTDAEAKTKLGMIKMLPLEGCGALYPKLADIMNEIHQTEEEERRFYTRT